MKRYRSPDSCALGHTQGRFLFATVRVVKASCRMGEMVGDSVKLYVWRLVGYGRPSYFVVVSTRDDAIAAVKKHGVCSEWPAQYELEAYEIGEVAENDNE